ncbi:MAG: tetratricopeptide repeat protein, partial [Acidobacteria bacterium]|nr:tetratricopeptide repeat protein [Acidobacteriota bacterium]
LQEGRPGDAISHLRIALKINPKLADAELNLATALGEKGELAEAVNRAHNALELEPKNAQAHRILGRILSFSGDLKGASDELRIATELDPSRPELHDELGSVWAQQQKLFDAPSAVARFNSASASFGLIFRAIRRCEMASPGRPSCSSTHPRELWACSFRGYDRTNFSKVACAPTKSPFSS